MEKLITIFVIDGNGDAREEFVVLPCTSVGQVLRRRGLEGFNLINLDGKTVAYEAEIFTEATKRITQVSGSQERRPKGLLKGPYFRGGANS
jgi:hypothetical protein